MPFSDRGDDLLPGTITAWRSFVGLPGATPQGVSPAQVVVTLLSWRSGVLPQTRRKQGLRLTHPLTVGYPLTQWKTISLCGMDADRVQAPGSYSSSVVSVVDHGPTPISWTRSVKRRSNRSHLNPSREIVFKNVATCYPTIPYHDTGMVCATRPLQRNWALCDAQCLWCGVLSVWLAS